MASLVRPSLRLGAFLCAPLSGLGLWTACFIAV
jgi:hypothetical protein